MAKTNGMVTTMDDKKSLLSEELIMIQHSGEIPEVAYHNSLYYLTEDPEGPGIDPREQCLESLKEAVINRYQTILLRDLNPENRDKRIYRGLARSAVNWNRLRAFAQREGFDISDIRAEAAKALKDFLDRETEEVTSGKRTSSINCTFSELKKFASDIGLSPDQLPKGVENLCPCCISLYSTTFFPE